MNARPGITKEIILQAADKIADQVNGDAATIALHYRKGMDGYQIARELDRYAGWNDLTMF